MKIIDKLMCVVIFSLLLPCTGCGDAPAPGRIKIAILDGGVQSCLLLFGIDANTYHHQAARRVARDFIVSARSADGVVEAIERIEAKVFILGTQFHPEKMLDEAPYMENIFRTFVEKAAAWSPDRTKHVNKTPLTR